MYSLSDSISSGVRLSAPSDDPTAWSKAINLKQGIREYDSILGNVDFATGWNEATDAALTNVYDLITQATNAGISAIGTNDSDKQAALITTLDTVLDELITAANSQYGDQYIFAGTNTGTSPYAIDDAGNVTYTGNSGTIKIKTGRSGETMTVNCTGTDVFEFESGGQTLNVIHEIYELKKAISNADINAVSGKLTTLQAAAASVSAQSATTGVTLSTLENKKSTVKTVQQDLTGWLSDTQDTDYTEALTKYSQATLAYQAALKVTGQLQQLSLVNYM